MLGCMSLRDKTVLITGGAGPGMGRTMVEQFRAEGARVVAVDIDTERISALVGEFPDVTGVTADISTPEGADTAIASAGRVDVLCNHGGIGGRGDGFAFADTLAEDVWDRMIATNLTGPFLLTKRALPGMVERGGGVIINTASVAGMRGARGGAAYTAAKWGLVGLTQNVAATFADKGIRCNAICPGPTGHRPLSEAAGDLDERAVRLLTRDRDKPAPCPPELVASVAVFLAGDSAARINGAIIPVDGGWSAY
jgi:NAD(P)-dependent dehydrogenase (short-subunit alcohol dehydrogenase family)